MTRATRIALLFLSAGLGAASLPCLGVGYPEKPIRLVVPFPPGGSTGFTAKVLAEQLEKLVGQPVTLDTKTGNYGINAIQELAGKSDGYTLMVGSVITNSMTPVMHRDKMSFDYDKTVVPVTRLAEFPSVVMTQSDAGVDTVKELLAHLQKGSGKLRFGTDFRGTFVDVDSIMLGKSADLKVSYREANGAVAILNDLAAGKIDLAILNVATATANIGKYKALAVTGSRRLANFPNVPTMREAGFEGIGTSNWQGLFVPAGTSREIIETLHRSVVRAMNSEESRSAFTKIDAAVVTSESPAKFADEIAAERGKWEKLIPEVMALPQE